MRRKGSDNMKKNLFFEVTLNNRMKACRKRYRKPDDRRASSRALMRLSLMLPNHLYPYILVMKEEDKCVDSYTSKTSLII